MTTITTLRTMVIAQAEERLSILHFASAGNSLSLAVEKKTAEGGGMAAMVGPVELVETVPASTVAIAGAVLSSRVSEGFVVHIFEVKVELS